MFENPSHPRKKLLERARAEAQKRSHVCVEPLHLVLAMVSGRLLFVPRVLRQLRISVESIRLEVELLAAREPSVPGIERPPLSASVKRVLELAALEAQEAGSSIVSDAYILLGLVRLEKPPLADLFRRVGLTLDAIRPLVPGDPASQELVPVEKLLNTQDKLQSAAKDAFSGLLSTARERERLREYRDALEQAKRNLDACLKDAKEKLAQERDKIREERKALEREKEKLATPSGAAACPLGHGAMDRVEREGVRLAVCPECLGTYLEPGQLDALVKKLSELSPDALHRFLEPEEPTDPT